MHKVVEEWDINPGKMIYLDIISQKKPGYGGSKNWILLQEPDTNKNGLSSQTQEKNVLKINPHTERIEDYK